MKTDLKEIASYTARRGVFEIVDVPLLRYLMVDGHGDPNAQPYADAISTLVRVTYRLKFMMPSTMIRCPASTCSHVDLRITARRQRTVSFTAPSSPL